MTINEAIQTKSFLTEHHKAVVNLAYTHCWLQQKQIHWLKPYGLSIQQFNILRILRGQYPKPSTVNLLIDRMLDKSSNASRLVERLRVKGLAKRSTNKIDKRKVDITITKSGLTLLEKIDESYDCFEQQFHHLTDDEAHTLNYLLDKLRNY